VAFRYQEKKDGENRDLINSNTRRRMKICTINFNDDIDEVLGIILLLASDPSEPKIIRSDGVESSGIGYSTTIHLTIQACKMVPF
jgi:hypothetical protein